ncbi:MAG: hypothetical protein EOP11_12000, partial [Proteobacteria bacterium]
MCALKKFAAGTPSRARKTRAPAAGLSYTLEMRIPKQSKPVSGASPEALVAGAGLSGLLTAATLLKAGKSVHLTEKLNKPGGRLSPEAREGFLLGAGFAFGNAEWWRAAGDRLGFAADTVPVNEAGALVHGSRGWVEMEAVPGWEEYLATPCTEFPLGGNYGITERLLEFCASHDKFSFSLEAPLTAIEGDNGVVKSVSLGAELNISPGEVHYAADYKT